MFKLSKILVAVLALFIFNISSMHRNVSPRDWCDKISHAILKERIALSYSSLPASSLIKIVDNFTKCGFKIDAQDARGETALINAIIINKLETAQALMLSNANVSIKDKEGKTALYYAACYGHKKIARELINAGAEINEQSNSKTTPLIIAIDDRQCYMEIVEMLIDQGANINCKNANNTTPLSAAIEHDHVWIAKLLLSKGVHVDQKSLALSKKWDSYPYLGNFRQTSQLLKEYAAKQAIVDNNSLINFFHAVKNNDVSNLKALARLVDINQPETSSQKTALTIAIEQDFFEIAHILIECGANVNALLANGQTLLTKASLTGDRGIIEFLLSKGANIDGADRFENTPLIAAVKHQQEEIAELLIFNQANIEIFNTHASPLMIAAKKGFINIVRLLIEAAKNSKEIKLDNFVNVKNSNGETALFYALKSFKFNKTLDIIELLLSNHADINMQNKSGQNILMQSIKFGLIELANFLLNNHADIHKQDLEGNTALIYAISNGYDSLSNRLISMGANIDAKNRNSNTLLLEATLKNKPEIVDYCIKHGANLQAKTIDGLTALKIAKYFYSTKNNKENRLLLLLENAWDTSNESEKLTRQQNDWEPEDIVEPSQWKSENPEDFNLHNFTNNNLKIRKRDSYNPLSRNCDTLILWVVIHGTWGTETASYFDDTNSEEQNYRHIKRTAAYYATVKGKPLELLSYLWSGEASDSARIIAAETLHKFFEHNEFYTKAEIVLLGHSHGCNVANYVTRLASPERIFIYSYILHVLEKKKISINL